MQLPPHPGKVLKKLYMDSLNLSLKHLAAYLDMDIGALEKFINEEIPLTLNIASKLSEFSHRPIEEWLELQTTYEVYAVNREKGIIIPAYHKYVN